MAKLGRNRMWREVATPQDGSGAQDVAPPARYCALCGQEATPGGPVIERFGEAFCSDAHAEEFTKEVRAARVRAAAVVSPTDARQPAEAADATPHQRNWKASLGKALCWGAPLLALVLVLGGGLGGGSALASAASGLLPVLALLACPLGMYFMMRSMGKSGQQDDGGDKGGQK